MPMLTSALALVLLFQAAPSAPPAGQKPAARGGTLDVRVTDRTGAIIEGATVNAEGPVSREGVTDSGGAVTFRNLTAGTYRFRFDRDGFLTLEKEVAIRAGAPASVQAALTPSPKPVAPPPAPPPPAKPAAEPPAPALTAGQPRVLSIPDFAEKQLITNRETTKETPIGCSGATATRMIQTRAPLAPHTHADADEVIYIVAGDATLLLAGTEHRITSGSLAIVPRGAEHSLTRRGGNPVILISTLGGPRCQ